MMKISKLLVEEGVLTFGDFTLKSGRKAPYFLNFGNIKTGKSISELSDFYSEILIKNVDLKNRILFGPAYKGIPLVVAVAFSLIGKGFNVPFCYNRKEAKDHGERGSLVGAVPKAGDKITVIEDVMTAGTALRETMKLEGFEESVDSCIIAVDRMERGKSKESAVKEMEREFGIKIYSISNIRDIVDDLYESGQIQIQTKSGIEDYLKEFRGE